MAGVVAHGDDKDRPRRHAGPRKRRPKKKKKKEKRNEREKGDCQLSCRSDGSVMSNQGPHASISPLESSTEDEKQCQTGSFTAAELFTSIRDNSDPFRGLVTASEALESTLAIELVTRQSDPFANGRAVSFGTPRSVSRPLSLMPFRQSRISAEERASLRLEQAHRTAERAYWTQWVIEAAENERARRLNVLRQLQCEEEEEVQRRRQWAIATIEKEQKAMMREMFLDNMKNTQWFQSTISRFSKDYEVVCPNSWCGCTYSCMLKDLELHLGKCAYRQVPDSLDQVVEDSARDLYSYDVVCPNAMLGCREICSRENLVQHLASCSVNGISREKEWEERLEWRRSVNQATEKERERRIDEEREEGRVNGCGLSFGNLQRLYEEQTAMMQVVLHDEILDFYDHHQREALEKRLWIQKGIAMVTEEIERLWNHCVQVEQYGSLATGLHEEASDVDLVVFGATEEFNCTGQQCVKALADHFRELSAFSGVSAITRAPIPLLKVVVLVSGDNLEATEGKHVERDGDAMLRIPFDITFDEPRGIHHNGIASVTLVQGLVRAFYGLRELTLVLKCFLVKCGLNDPAVGGLSSYGLLLMVVYVLQEQGALILLTDGQRPSQGSIDRVDIDERKGGARCPNARWNLRYESQRLKGEVIAKEIIKQCSARQQPPDAGKAARSCAKKAKRAVFSTFVTGSETGDALEAKPYLLGKLLMDILQFYGNDFRQNFDQISVVSWREPSWLTVETTSTTNAQSPPAHTLLPLTAHPSPTDGRCSANSPLMLAPPLFRDGLFVIEDPLQPDNNVGKTCYRVSQVFRDFSDFLSFLTALIVRGSVMTTGKKKTMDASGDDSCSSSSSSIPSTAHESTCRILKSVFEMKTREECTGLKISSSSRDQTSTT
uniref:Poly(A) RNA polymerase mitochondrial-like central palm domain-containing protein n=1 Tax=Peronospora matthiolae TaxID=2874970 RepID=A0AAV1TXZ8_9STRA